MANVQVIFDRIEVDKDGDPGITDGGGEFYYTLNVNGSRVGYRSVSNVRTAHNGDVIDLNASKSVELESDEELIVSGFVAEKDQLGTGADDRDDFTHTYDRSENWGDGAHSAVLSDRKMACTLRYTVQAE